MTDDMLGPSPIHIKYLSYETTDFAYDRPIFLVPLNPSYPSSTVSHNYTKIWSLAPLIMFPEY